MPVASPEGQLVVQLKKIRQSDGLPTPQEARGDMPILLGALGLDVDLMAI